MGTNETVDAPFRDVELQRVGDDSLQSLDLVLSKLSSATIVIED